MSVQASVVGGLGFMRCGAGLVDRPTFKAMKKELTITEFARMGGLASARKLSAKERSARAKKAVLAREEKKKKSLDIGLVRL